MICKNCGYENDSNAVFCVNCGSSLNQESQTYGNAQPYGNAQAYGNGYYADNGGYYEEPAVVPPRESSDGMGVVSMILGIVSLVICNPGGIFAIVGLILGIMSSKKAKAKGEKSSFAVAGIVTCAIALGIMLLAAIGSLIYIIFFGGAAVLMGLLGLSTTGGYYY